MQTLALYIHWPFCASLCPYCDFTRGLWSQAPTQDVTVWLKAYKQELSYWCHRLGPRKITSIFFGGGTPSLMPLPLLEGILIHIDKIFKQSHSFIEVTLEMNPTGVELKKLQDIISLGVNRISVGVQSLQDKILTFLGRKHSAQEARTVLYWLKERGVRFSLDLMYAHAYHQNEEVWQEELKEAVHLAGNHISLYQLTVEAGTPFHRYKKQGNRLTLDSAAAADLYVWTDSYLEFLGWQGYEISNYALKEEYCSHNLSYWRYEDYLGIGTGAHGRVTLPCATKYAIVNDPRPECWLNRCTTSGNGIRREYPLKEEAQFKERMLMGLRLKEGMSLTSPLSPSFRLKIQDLKDAGYVVEDKASIQLTREGRLRLDGILAFLWK
ncbi:radical SAM family heme chaperone HemW [Holospora curviuscula]|uniref:Heme chaperone HemW n=1 Tax=Holospora curviuscula TaxID=1082868 RepID=A0A2S5R7I1_9PROT|nr:radical SAM family heme chaperone HemW [Holospora curviuscula]PPE03260.1 Oxygen-independent coproporphyrinogen-III oxidase 1 [Holospora curviuscula]